MKLYLSLLIAPFTIDAFAESALLEYVEMKLELKSEINSSKNFCVVKPLAPFISIQIPKINLFETNRARFIRPLMLFFVDLHQRRSLSILLSVNVLPSRTCTSHLRYIVLEDRMP